MTYLGICGLGALVHSSPTGQPLVRNDISRRNEIPRKTRLNFLCRKTYVCFRFRATVASRHCVKPEINGPLFYVNSTRSGEGKQGWGNPGNDRVLDPFICAASRLIDKITRTYLPRTAGQASICLSLKDGARVSGGKMKRMIDYSQVGTERFSPMREQRDKNIIAEWRDLPLWAIQPDIARAILDIVAPKGPKRD
jgi:hypothetical protein